MLVLIDNVIDNRHPIHRAHDMIPRKKSVKVKLSPFPVYAAMTLDLSCPVPFPPLSPLIVEIHPEPEAALSDGPQALRFSNFTELMRRIYQG